MLCEQIPGTRLLDSRIVMERALFQTRSAQSLLKLGRRPGSLECATAAMNTLADPTRFLAAAAAVGEESVPLFIDLGRVFTAIGEFAAAARALTSACDVADRLRNRSPATSRNQELAATAWNELASAQKRDPERRQNAAQSLMRALTIREDLVAQSPTNAELRLRLADTYTSLGEIFWDLKQLEKAEAVGRQEIDCLRSSVEKSCQPVFKPV